MIRVNAGRRPWLICYWCIPESAMPTPALSVGYYQLNSDTSLNFQLNRWLGYGSETLLADMRSVV
ncbi:MAG: hypothetical protein WB347_11955, partial [Terriglobales bacterium]